MRKLIFTLIILFQVALCSISFADQSKVQLSREHVLMKLNKLGIERPGVLERLKNKFFENEFIWLYFNYSMPSRYGLDSNHNSIIDMPNSASYVQNTSVCQCVNNDCENNKPTFLVQIDVSETTWPKTNTPTFGRVIDRKQPQSGTQQGPETHSPEGRFHIDSAIMYAEFRAKMRSTEVIFEAQGLAQSKSLNVPAINGKGEICLPEGKYEVTVIATDHFTGDHTTRKTDVFVEDVLIVAIGDSYGSGEGTPEKRLSSTNIDISNALITYRDENGHIISQQNTPATNEMKSAVKNKFKDQYEYNSIALWGDTGEHVADKFHTLLKSSIENTTNIGNGRSKTISYDFKIKTLAPDFSTFSDIHKEHYLMHRSSYAASSQLALDIEKNGLFHGLERNKSSVTYINLAMVGATIQEGVSFDYGGPKIGRFYNPSTKAKSQLYQLKNLVKNRTIDMLIVSSGGNDVGFAPLAGALVVREPNVGGTLVSGPNFTEISPRIKDGQWSLLEHHILGKIEFLGLVPPFNWTPVVGLEGLAGVYTGLKDLLQISEINVRQTYITEYPDFTEDQNGPCEKILTGFRSGREIGTGELTWAKSNFLDQVNSVMKTWSVANGWIYVDGIVTKSKGHGLCSEMLYNPTNYNPSHPVSDPYAVNLRWFRGQKASRVIQGENIKKTLGVLHPNEFGYRAIKEELKKKVMMQYW